MWNLECGMWNFGRRLAVAVILLLLMPMPSTAKPSAKPVAHPANMELSVYRRSFTTDEKVSVRLSAYNVKRASFAIYRLNLAALVPNSKALDDFADVIKGVDVRRLPEVDRFSYALGKIYPDQWEEREVKTPRLRPGVYLIAGDGAGSTARTWFAVTDVALVTKRSRQALLVYAVDARSGRPVPALSLTAVDSAGTRVKGVTDRDGIWRTIIGKADGNLWIENAGGETPAFVLSGAPPPPPAYTVYAYTDRPVYRPSQKVDFKGIVRERLEAEAPGGFVYKTYANKPVRVEIRDATDALIMRKHLTTNGHGSFDGELDLAPEPPLGKWQIVVSIGDFDSYASFDVQEYRKPEYTVDAAFDKPFYQSGETAVATITAKYFFGAPVPNAKVHYAIDFSSNADRVEPNFQGDAVTDDNGQVRLEIPTKRLPDDRTVSLDATITPSSRRQMQVSASTPIYAGLFTISLDTDRSSYRTGDPVKVTVETDDHNGKPVKADVDVSMVETLENEKHEEYEKRDTKKVTTDASTGKAIVTFKPEQPNDYTLEATAFDKDDDKIASEDGSFSVVRDEDYVSSSITYPTLALALGQNSYAPGATAKVTLQTALVTLPADRKHMEEDRRRQHAAAVALARRNHQPIPAIEPMPTTYDRAWALITVQGERLYRHFLLPLNAHTASFEIPVSVDYFPNAEISAVIVQDKHIYEQQATLNVERKEQKLTVSITPDKTHYQPGDTASYTLTTTDWRGKPVPAEVSLGVVDSSIYAIEQDGTPSIEGAFYSGQEVRVQTDFSFAAQYSGGAYQSVPAPMAAVPQPGQPAIRVRKQFADTAIWSPLVETGVDGVGHVTFTMPDNLTSWRATARGITDSTQVGESTNEVTSSMPLMVRLEQPRFYVQGDDTVVSAIVNNKSGSAKTVDITLTADGMTVDGEKHRKIDLPDGGEKRIDWKAHVTGPDSATVTVTADGGPGAQDATQSTLSVKPDGLKMYEAKSYVLPATTPLVGQASQPATTPIVAQASQPATTPIVAQASLPVESVTTDLSSLPPGAKVTLTLSPSVASSMFTALDYLTDYPYGCAEQTMSAFLPDVFVGRALHRLHVTRKLHADPDKLVNFGLQKLYRYQHGDGGWHWWENDQSDPEMTAYVLWGLCQARDAGYTVDDQRIKRGAAAVVGFVQQEKDPSTRAEYLLALACADPSAAAKPLEETYAKRSELDTYGLASLSLALRQAGGKLLPLGNELAGEIEKQAKDQRNFTYWPSGEQGYTWHADTIFVTAHALRAVLAADPHWPGVPRVVAWLMAQRSGDAWSTTRTSAEVLYALSKYMELTNELQPRFDAKVSLDGDVVKTIPMNDAFADPSTVTFTPAQLAGHKKLTVDKSGDGVLYVTAGIDYRVDPDHVTARNDGLGVTRSYQVTADDPSKANVTESGDAIPVHVDISSTVDYPYAMLEEPIPAGCEVDQSDDDDYGGAYSRREVRDDRIVFFFDDLPAGHTGVDYTLRTETPGSYRILPGIGELVYHPELRGNTGLARMNVEDRP